MNCFMNIILLSFSLLVPVWSQESSTMPSQPCWADAFPNMTQVRGGNEITCEICTTIFQGLDDYLLENEDQVNDIETGIRITLHISQIAHALENLCEGFPWLFEVIE